LARNLIVYYGIQYIDCCEKKMNKEINDINELVDVLTGIVVQLILNDDIWKKFGFKKRPRKGHVWHRIFPKKFELNNLIIRETITMGLIDTFNGIKKSNLPIEIKLLISTGLIDRTLPTISHLFDAEVFIDNLISTYHSCSSCEKSNFHEPFIHKSKDILSKKDFAKFLVGVTTLLGAPPFTEDLLISSEYIKDLVENITIEKQLVIEMPEDLFQEYATIMSKEVFDI